MTNPFDLATIFLAKHAQHVAAVATGLLAWRWQLESAPLKGILLLHAVFGGASAGAILLLWWLQVRQRTRSGSSPSPVYFAVTAVAFVIVALTGHLRADLLARAQDQPQPRLRGTECRRDAGG